MDERKPVARGAIVADEQWEKALQEVLEQTRGTPVDLALLFASGEYAEYFPTIVRTVRRETGASLLVGCSGQGIIGAGVELEDIPSISLLTLSLPGASLHATHLTQKVVEDCESAQDWWRSTRIPLDEVHAWLIFADPFQMDCESLVAGLARAYPGLPMLGGMASGDMAERRTHVFLNDDVYDEGAVALALGGPYSILPLVSQGCNPIGEPWTITKVLENGLIGTISNRAAYEVLVETLQHLPPEMQKRTQRNLLVGLAADEYHDSFGRGNFLIRNLLGVDRRSGALAVGGTPRVGQTIQFQVRDAATADLDLKDLLQTTRDDLKDNKPIAGILCTCNGRGEGLFGIPDHDAGMIAQELGALPLAGLFCNGEIGPVGTQPFLHGFTASLALIVKHQAA